MPLGLLQAFAQPFPRCFIDRSRLFRSFPSMPDIFTSRWKANRWCVRMFTKMMVHFYWYAGTGVAPGIM